MIKLNKISKKAMNDISNLEQKATKAINEVKEDLKKAMNNIGKLEQKLTTTNDDIDSMKQNAALPSKPNVDTMILKNQMTIYIENTNKTITEYELKWSEIPYTIKPNVMVVLNNFESEQKINWHVKTIKPIKNKCIQNCIINIQDTTKRHIICVKSKNKYGNSPINYILLNPASKAPFESSIMKDYNINHEKLIQILTQQLNKPVQLKLLYSGQRDGFSATTFHKLCDYIGPTITLIRNDYNYIFGGYTSISWRPTGYLPAKDGNAFLFTIYPFTKVFVLKNKSDNYAIINDKEYFPVFGQGRDLCIHNNCNNNVNNYCDPKSYHINNAKNFIGNDRNFKVIDINVLQVNM